MQSAVQRLIDTARNPNDSAASLIQQGKKVIRIIGQDAPFELFHAMGLLPIIMLPNANPTPHAEKLLGTANINQKTLSLLEQILSLPAEVPVVITHADSDNVQLHASLRDLINSGDIAPRKVYFIDLLHMPRASTAIYNRRRLEQLHHAISKDLDISTESLDWHLNNQQSEEIHNLLNELKTLKQQALPKLKGSEFIAAVIAAHILPSQDWITLTTEVIAECHLREPIKNQRIAISGGSYLHLENVIELENAGYHIALDHNDWGDPKIAAFNMADFDGLKTCSEPSRRTPSHLLPSKSRQMALIEGCQAASINNVAYLYHKNDEGSAWDAEPFTRACIRNGLSAIAWDISAPMITPLQFRHHLPEKIDEASVIHQRKTQEKAKQGPGERSKKQLQSLTDFGAYQRQWFQTTRQQANNKVPFAVVGANSPQEILRAMNIPFVVNQWWASIVAAKRQTPRYTQLLEQAGYPSNVEAYSSQGLAAFFDKDTAQAPWGGLPTPTIINAVLSSDATARIHDYWAQESQQYMFLFERSVDPRQHIDIEWWDKLPNRWDEMLENERLDLMVAEMSQLIAWLEKTTDRRFDQEKFEQIMHLVNEQETYYRKTRDLIATAPKAPVSIVDTMPATMVPQWHRGTEWARDAAKAFYEEVSMRIEQKQYVCRNEKIRLMWIGRGVWGDTNFYQRWEESHNAVFVWSMYLGLAADGYIRKFDNGRDPMRALAARFITMGDELRMPSWASAWYVKEAIKNRAHGAVALSDADPFVIRALKKANIPVLSLALDNFSHKDGLSSFEQQITDFIESL